MDKIETAPKLIGLNKWLSEIGVTATTGWRWRKRGIIKTINIYGRLHVTAETANNFIRRAEAGEFSKESRLSKTAAQD